MEVVTTQRKEISPKETVDALKKIMSETDGASVADAKAEVGLGCRYEHEFTEGLYVRKMFMPKDLIFVTKVHKIRHPYFVMYGDVSVYLDGEMVRIEAPFNGITEPGTRRALRTHTDTLWITVHVTEKTDVEEICKDVIFDTVEEYETWQKQLTDKRGN